MAEAGTDHRRAIAERSIAAILDATERLLSRGDAATTTAVAAEAGVSRVTVYSHFPAREDLLAAVTERAVRRATETIAAAGLERGPALQALDRLIDMAWAELDRDRTAAGAATQALSPKALARAHEAMHVPIFALIERGRAEGVFRDDVPAEWLASSYFALMHACGEAVRCGAVAAQAAPRLLQEGIRGVWVGPARRPRR